MVRLTKLPEKAEPDDIYVAIIFDKAAGADEAAMLKADARRIWRAHRIEAFANAGQFFNSSATRVQWVTAAALPTYAAS